MSVVFFETSFHAEQKLYVDLLRSFSTRDPLRLVADKATLDEHMTTEVARFFTRVIHLDFDA